MIQLLLLLASTAFAAPRYQYVPHLTEAHEITQVKSLAHDAYVDQGYILPQPDGLLHLNEQFDTLPQTSIAAVKQGRNIIASLSYVKDSNKKLPVNADFQPFVERIRYEGKSIAALYRLVADNKFRNNYNLIVHLFDNVMVDMLDKGISTGLIEVNPKHASFYENRFGAINVAAGRATGLESPAVLLRINRAEVLQRVDVEEIRHQRKLK